MSAEIRIAPFSSSVQNISIDLEFFKGLLDQMSDGVFVANRNRQFLYCNEAFFRLTGYKAEEITGHYCRGEGDCPIGHLGQRLCQESCPLLECINDGGPREVKAFLRRKQGGRVPVEVSVHAIRAVDGSIVGAVEFFKDDSAGNEARRKSAAMERLAFLDPLCHIPNRRFLAMSLDTAMREYRVTKVPFAVMMIDLNGFKTINDLFGHTSGDHALEQVAKILVRTLRPTDTVGRWGGDEFLAIIRNANNEILGMLADRCAFAITRNSFFVADGQPLSLTISVGGTAARRRDSVNTLVKRADGLMYENKTARKDRSTDKAGQRLGNL